MGVRYTDDLFARKRQWKVQWQHQIDTFQLEGWRQVTSREAGWMSIGYCHQTFSLYHFYPNIKRIIRLAHIRVA